MKIFKKIILLIVVLLVLWLAFDSLVIGLPKKGVVIDSVTKKPIEGIYLVRQTNVIVPGLEQSHERRLRSVVVATDKNGQFYFSPFVRLKFPLFVSYRELLNINYSGEKYYDEKDNLLTLKYNTTYFDETYGVGFSDGLVLISRKPYKQVGHTYKPFNNKTMINLAPIVSSLDKCMGDSECLEKNKELARICAITPFDQPGSSFLCKDFSLKGAMIFKNNIPLLDVLDDFSACNNEADDTNATLCFTKIVAFSNAVISEPACSILIYETARNLCYFRIAINSESKPLCDKITKKPIPDISPMSADRHAYDGIIDYNTLCFKERARKYGQ